MSLPDPKRWKALALLCAAQFIVILDTSIIGVALPAIQPVRCRCGARAPNRQTSLSLLFHERKANAEHPHPRLARLP